jgi:type I restriction enzyme R subunit
VFARPLRSAILYKQMKGRGTRLCEDIDKRYFTIFDYSGASQLEDAEFDGHPANRQKALPPAKSPRKPGGEARPKPIGEGVSVVISAENRYVCLADGRKIPFEDYAAQSREFILDVSKRGLDELLRIWIDKSSRQELREAMRDRDIYPAAFRHYLDLPEADDVDILAKIGFQLPRVPNRVDRANRLWDQDQIWLLDQLGESHLLEADRFKLRVWQTALDHYGLFGIDDLEQARTYGTPQFAEQFGSFTTLTGRYGGPALLKADLEAIKRHLYVPMAA